MFPILSGMEPFNWLRPRCLHHNIYTSWVGPQIQCLPHQVCIVFSYVCFFIIPHSSIFVQWLRTILSRLTMTPLRQRCPNENDIKFPCSRKYSLRIPSTNVSAPKYMLYSPMMFAIFVAKIWFQSIHAFSTKLSQAYDGPHSQRLALKYNSLENKGCQVSNLFGNGGTLIFLLNAEYTTKFIESSGLTFVSRIGDSQCCLGWDHSIGLHVNI